MNSIFQIGLAAADLDEARRFVSTGLGVSWGAVQTRDFAGATYHVSWTRDGPPFIEVIEGEQGTPWHQPQGLRLDHLARWCDDLAATVRSLEMQGFGLELDHRTRGRPAVYLRSADGGLRLELIERSYRHALAEAFDVELP